MRGNNEIPKNPFNMGFSYEYKNGLLGNLTWTMGICVVKAYAEWILGYLLGTMGVYGLTRQFTLPYGALVNPFKISRFPVIFGFS